MGIKDIGEAIFLLGVCLACPVFVEHKRDDSKDLHEKSPADSKDLIRSDVHDPSGHYCACGDCVQ